MLVVRKRKLDSYDKRPLKWELVDLLTGQVLAVTTTKKEGAKIAWTILTGGN